MHFVYVLFQIPFFKVVCLKQLNCCTTSIFFQKYNQFLLAAKEALVKYITVHYKGTNDAWDFSSISAILEVIVRDLR